MHTYPTVQWIEGDEPRSARWRSESGVPPGRVVVADDRLSADEAYGLACQGTGLLWRGDYQNARQLLSALGSRADRRVEKRRKPGKSSPALSPAEEFHAYRQARSQRARTLNSLLVPLAEDYAIPLRRAPNVRKACEQVYGAAEGPSVAPLRALLGVIGAYEWRVKGIEIPEVGGRIHPHYGVFSPVRNEYVHLVSAAALPEACAQTSTAFDIGTGTGVLAAVLARRGIQQVVATDQDARALACARENLERLGLASQVSVVEADLFPPGRAALVVCNPPWLPGRASSAIERGIYDHDSRMLRGFLKALPAHLEPQGEGWLILSDLAEHVGLRTRPELLAAIDEAGLKVLDRSDVRPTHPRASDPDDPLHAARAAEVTSLWRLAPQ